MMVMVMVLVMVMVMVMDSLTKMMTKLTVMKLYNDIEVWARKTLKKISHKDVEKFFGDDI